jgi:hypothetical protein
LKKKSVVAFLSLGIILVISYLFLITDASFEDRICDKITEKDNGCFKVYHVDVDSKLIFYQNNAGLMYAMTNDGLTKVKSVNGYLDFNWENEIDEPLIWGGTENPQDNFSIIWGFSNNKVKSIIIKSEDNLQPNKIKIRENLWLWYVDFNDSKLNKPIMITAYDEKGNLLYGK